MRLLKIFRFICCALLIALSMLAGYYALIYKASLSTGVFFITLGLTFYVLSDGGSNKKNAPAKK